MIKEKITFIYAIVHPTTGKVRYIGKSNDPQVRLRKHIKDARDGKTDHKSRWIAKILKNKLRPNVIILEECLYQKWKTQEIWWIEYYRNQGADLTNHKNGGDGTDPDEEAKAKMRKAKLGKPPHNKGKKTPIEIRIKQSESAKQRWQNYNEEEKQELISKLKKKKSTPRPKGWKHTKETRAKISKSLVGNKRTLGYKHSEETKRKFSKIKLGHKVTDETRRKISWANRKLSSKQVEEIRQMMKEGIKQKDVAEQFNVAVITIHKIKHNKYYENYD